MDLLCVAAESIHTGNNSHLLLTHVSATTWVFCFMASERIQNVMSGIVKEDFLNTFTTLNYHSSGESCPDVDRGFFVAFLFQNDIAERRSFLYREGLKTFALEWVEQRCKDGRRFYFASSVTNNAQKLMLQNQTTKVATGYNEYQPNVKAILHFYEAFGTARQIEDDLYHMLADSISNPESKADWSLISSRMYLYRQLKELFDALEPVNLSANNLTEN